MANVKIVDWIPQSDLLGKRILPLQAATMIAFPSPGTFSLGFVAAPIPTWVLHCHVKGEHLLTKKQGTIKGWLFVATLFIYNQTSYL